MNRYAIYDGNEILSPMFVILLVFGLLFMIVPPVGMALIVGAIVSQVRFRRRAKAARRPHHVDPRAACPFCP